MGLAWRRALLDAVHANDVDEVRRLQDGKVLIVGAYEQAVQWGCIDIIRYYLDRGMDPDAVLDQSLPRVVYDEGGHLDEALEMWSRSIVKEENCYEWQRTLLGSILRADNVDHLQRAIEYGIPWRHAARDRHGPLPKGSRSLNVLKYFVRLGFDVHGKTGECLLHDMCICSGIGTSAERALIAHYLLDQGVRTAHIWLNHMLLGRHSMGLIKRLLCLGMRFYNDGVIRDDHSSFLRKAGYPRAGTALLVDIAARAVRENQLPTEDLPVECIDRVLLKHA